jgi:hypothetical protein
MVDFKLNFKHIVLCRLDELMDPPYMDGKFEIFSFHPNSNRNKIPLIVFYIAQIVHNGPI